MSGKKKTDDKPAAIGSVEELLSAYSPDDYIVGIDEAGRGPVLGPMVYGIAFCRIGDYQAVSDLGVADSKQLTEAKRDMLRDAIQKSSLCEYMLQVLPASLISESMLRRKAYNLNEMSHDSATYLISKVVDATGGPLVQTSGSNLEGQRGEVVLADKCLRSVPVVGFKEFKRQESPGTGKVRVAFVDVVGPEGAYRKKLQTRFPWMEVVVEKKADSKYPIVSAASIMAKTERDKIITQWDHPEVHRGSAPFPEKWGSGYPGDEVTKAYLRESMNPVFGFGDFVRFSWGTAKELLGKRGVTVAFDGDEEDTSGGLMAKKPRRCQYFQELKLTTVDNFRSI